jgi:hypothetical protein
MDINQPTQQTQPDGTVATPVVVAPAPEIQTDTTQIQAAPQEQQQTQVKNGKVITIPTNAMAKIKQEERERGKRNALKERDAEARTMGFKDYEDLKRFASTKGNSTQAKPQQKPAQAPVQQTTSQPVSRHNDQRIQQLQEDKRKANRARAQEEKRRKQVERQSLEMQAEMELKMIAVRCGVKDVDYAVALLKRQTTAMTKEQLNTFDEDKYFHETLRQTHPYLYGEQVLPADTSATPVQGAPPPAAPTSKEVTKEVTSNGMIDAKTLTRDEFNKMLVSRGLGGALSGATPV